MFKKLLLFTRNGDGGPDHESLTNGHRHERVERLDEEEIPRGT